MIKTINSLCKFFNEYLFQYAKQKLLLWIEVVKMILERNKL